ncbi:hypothetical protein TeGR_g9015 [Tetraparma gracilis]|uniref:Glutathione S-transferase n=1 Tax=Tetraparma gracilis TaxID=2962635 RepID=A0ABQ6MJ72_9STRA|nr:hypothetical protein TeGR_g9015 [Tetraparma gracilis]
MTSAKDNLLERLLDNTTGNNTNETQTPTNDPFHRPSDPIPTQLQHELTKCSDGDRYAKFSQHIALTSTVDPSSGITLDPKSAAAYLYSAHANQNMFARQFLTANPSPDFPQRPQRRSGGGKWATSPAAGAHKFAELWKQLSWLEENAVGPYLVGDSVSFSDFAWFPTLTFMELMLPLYGWGDVFDDQNAATPFPKIAKWYSSCWRDMDGFRTTREEVLEYWQEMKDKGQFEPTLEEIREAEAQGRGLKFKYP